MTQSANASSKFVWPPVIYGAAFLAAYFAGGWVALPVAPRGGTRIVAIYAGLALVGAGLAIALVAEFQFIRAQTATLPIRPASALVTGGIYRFSRNPMYLGMSFVLAGFGLAANSLWYLLALAPAMYAVFRLAIEPEERYLETKFGEAYRSYRRRARRWL